MKKGHIVNKQEFKYFNTASYMDEALLYFLEQKEFEFITVKEICKKAGVNRSTFYLHYENMDDLLEETISYVNKKFMSKFDEIDNSDTVVHMLLCKDDEPIATCRFFKVNNEYKIGRIAVVKEYRGQGIGRIIVSCAEEKVYELGGRELCLSSQVRVQGFYEKLGYVAEGEIYMDQMCPHIKMKKKLEGSSL